MKVKSVFEESQQKRILTLLLSILCCFYLSAEDTLLLRKERRIDVSVSKEEQSEINQQTVSATNDTTNRRKPSNARTVYHNSGRVDLSSSQNLRNELQLGIYAGLIRGPMDYITSGIDYLFTPNISAEFNYSITPLKYNLISYYTFGGKYWFANKNSSSGFSPYIGLLYGNASSSQSLWSIPVGINYIARYGLQSSLQFIYMKASHEIWYPYIEFRIGWRFKTRKE